MPPKTKRKGKNYGKHKENVLLTDVKYIVSSVKNTSDFLTFRAEPLIFYIELPHPQQSTEEPSEEDSEEMYEKYVLNYLDEMPIPVFDIDSRTTVEEASQLYLTQATLNNIIHHINTNTISSLTFPLRLGNEYAMMGGWSANCGENCSGKNYIFYSTFEDSEDTHLLSISLLRTEDSSDSILVLVLWTLERCATVIPSMLMGCYSWYIEKLDLRHFVEFLE